MTEKKPRQGRGQRHAGSGNDPRTSTLEKALAIAVGVRKGQIEKTVRRDSYIMHRVTHSAGSTRRARADATFPMAT